MEGVGVVVDGAPFARVELVGGFFLPVLDEVLDEEFERGGVGFPVGGLCGLKGGVVKGVVGCSLVSPFGICG